MEEENNEKREENNFNVDNSNSNNNSEEKKVESNNSEEKKVEESSPIVSMGASPVHAPAVNIKKDNQLTKKMRENPWMLSTLVLGAIVLALFFLGNFSGGLTGNVVSEDVVGQNLIDYLNAMPSVQDEITLVSVEEGEGNMYLVTVEYDGEEIPVYVTKDGKYYTPSLSPMSVEDIIETSEVAETPEVEKSDDPVTELFIMTHCPYGTQAEKGIIPTIKAMGSDSNIKIRYVHYFMHEPEETETPRQICIREEQSDKFIPYLECFLEGDGNPDASGYMSSGNDPEVCMDEVGVDKAAVEECVSNGNYEKYYAEDSELSEAYGVQGSPALVVNGVITSSGRDSQSYLNTICSAFNVAPEVCSIAELSSSSPSPGFGWDGIGSATTASC